MKYLPCLICLLVRINSFAQLTSSDSATVKKAILKTTIKTTGKKLYTAFLVNVTDTNVLTYSEPVKFSAQIPVSQTTNFSYSSIKTIHVWRRGSVGRGMLWGSLSGALIGVAAGLIEGDDPVSSWFGFSATEKAAIYGVSLASVGALTGAIVGAVAKKKFIIHGRKENLKALQQYILNKNQALISN